MSDPASLFTGRIQRQLYNELVEKGTLRQEKVISMFANPDQGRQFLKKLSVLGIARVELGRVTYARS